MSRTLRGSALTDKMNISENQPLMARKATVATRPAAVGAKRAVFGDIGNSSRVAPGQNAALKKPLVTADTRKPLARNKATSSLRKASSVDVPKPEPKPAKPFSAAEEYEKLNSYSSKLLVEDIDAEDAENPQLVSEYIKDIYLYLRYLEDKFRVNENHLQSSQITGKMREILIDWLVQVHLKFKLLHETLYLTVAIIDRYLQADQSVSPDQLQMVGVTSMWIASKFEEIYAPEVNDFVVIADRAFNADQMRAMERQILTSLQFDLARPLPLHFLRRNSKAGLVDTRQHTLAKYLMELSLQEYQLAHYRVSQLAAAALCLSLRVLKDENTTGWTDVLSHYSFYSEAELKPLMSKLAALVLKANDKLSDTRAKRVAVARKYSGKKFLCISQLPELSGPEITELAAEALL